MDITVVLANLSYNAIGDVLSVQRFNRINTTANQYRKNPFIKTLSFGLGKVLVWRSI